MTMEELELECEKERLSQKEEDRLEREENQRYISNLKLEAMTVNSIPINNFLEIAFKKKNIEDEHGFKNHKAFDLELNKFLKKLEFYYQKYGESTSFVMSLIKEELIKKYDEYKLARLLQPIIKTIPIQNMTGIEFEKHLIEQLKRNPQFSQVKGTKGSGDGGADILFSFDGEKGVIQAKRWKQRVGNKAIQEVFTAKQLNKCNLAVVVTNSTFTKQAIEEALKVGVILIDGDNLYRIENGTFLS